MLTVCVCTQPTYFRTLCEWTLCNRPHSASHPRLGGDPICGRLWPLPLFVLIFTSAKQTSVPGETLCPHRQTGRKLCNKIPKAWMVSGQEKKKERKHVVHHITQTLKPTEWAAAGIQNPTRGGKEEQMHPKEQNDAVNCFDFFSFFHKKAFCLLPRCKHRARLKHLLMR